MATGPYRRPGPGPWRVGSRRTTDASQPETVGVLPTFISAGPERGLDPIRVAGYALIIASAFDPQGPSLPSQLTFGTHAQNAYEQNTTRALYKPLVGTTPSPTYLLNSTFAPHQDYLDVHPAVWGTAPTIQGPVPPLTEGAPAWDLTTAALVVHAATPPPALTGAVPPLVSALPVYDLTEQATLSRPLLGNTPQPIPLQLAAPVYDLTISARVWESLVAQGPVPPLTSAATVPDTSQLGSFTIAAAAAHALAVGPVPPLVQNANRPQDIAIHLGVFIVKATPNPPIIPPQTGKLHPLGFAMIRLGGGGSV